MRLKDKVAIVTGGMQGNGRGIADRMMEEGAKVYVIDISAKPIKGMQTFLVDIRDKKAIKEIVDGIAAENDGHIDILVNNAGVIKLTPFLETTDEMRDFQFDTNIKGNWIMAQAVLPYMVANKYGRIVTISSVSGIHVADPYEVAYVTTKAAILGFTRGIAIEFAPYGITVNTIKPGCIDTQMMRNMCQDANPNNPEEAMDEAAVAIPLKRLGDVREVGHLAVFLASDEAAYITGSEYLIDGGELLPEASILG